ncbi:MAG TPA: glycosyltransferase [Candidatus Limnocylindrales bacterium]|nr:glycosyltransferase [Candidatus Limnocylindrales bacterium]
MPLIARPHRALRVAPRAGFNPASRTSSEASSDASPHGPGWLRPHSPGSGLPAPETTRRRWSIRAVALIALAVTAAYLAWRATATLDPSDPWLSVGLLVLEVHAALGLVLFTFSLWDVDSRPHAELVSSPRSRIAVLVPTYNEPPEILLPTIAAAVSMRLPHETWILDDGARPAIARLAADLGARYLARPTHEHAKAGNLNYALGIVDAEFIAVLDADHVASPDFLAHTLGYFGDERVALVQTPQDFYNRASFEHEAVGSEHAAFHEQTLFYRILQPGKNRWNAAFWCGTGAVVRVAALREIGGVATDTITEDIHTTIRLHRRGWRTVYHNEVLARGLAAGDADTYQAQRLRWGTGAMQVLRLESPLTVPGLTLGQRLGYAATLLGWFDAWRSLGFLLLPLLVVLTGAVPIRADTATFVLAFGSTFLLQQLALRALSRGTHRPILSLMFELVRLTPNLRATLTLLTRGRPQFAVTPKGRLADGRTRAHVPVVLRGVLAGSVLGAAWFALTLLGRTPVRYEEPWAIAAAFGWLVVNAALVFLAVVRVRSARYAPERRSSVRFEANVPGTFANLPCEILDLSLTGARIAIAGAPEPGRTQLLSLALGGRTLSIDATERSHRFGDDGRLVLGLSFADEITAERAELALALFMTRALPVADVVAADGAANGPAASPAPGAVRAGTFTEQQAVA